MSSLTVLWSQQHLKPMSVPPPLLPSIAVCACADSLFYCVGSQGKELWRFKTGGPIFLSYLHWNKIWFDNQWVYCFPNSSQLRVLFSTRRKMQWDAVEFLNNAIHWWITQLVSVTLTQDWIVIYPVDSSVQLTSIWDLMGKFIPQLNFKQIVTQHML